MAMMKSECDLPAIIYNRAFEYHTSELTKRTGKETHLDKYNNPFMNPSKPRAFPFSQIQALQASKVPSNQAIIQQPLTYQNKTHQVPKRHHQDDPHPPHPPGHGRRLPTGPWRPRRSSRRKAHRRRSSSAAPQAHPARHRSSSPAPHPARHRSSSPAPQAHRHRSSSPAPMLIGAPPPALPPKPIPLGAAPPALPPIPLGTAPPALPPKPTVTASVPVPPKPTVTGPPAGPKPTVTGEPPKPSPAGHPKH
ncbi:hypothetical protein B0H65DRAFT_445720 [Neurospora tetraspora]|uniref:Uncharacterized protein n=1 Tax=Neurospora tetraspora TaxID=94610 RepID=A0AAE0MNV3_9PEZI|nr:hypothetical protein B0H65DRAFT_445720 [Neurospora tetraspora]